MGKMKELYMKYVEMGIIQDGILPEKYLRELPQIEEEKDSDDTVNNVNLEKK